MESKFMPLIRGEIPCHKILESDRFLAFLESSPMREGHTLVIPKKEWTDLFEMDEEELGALMAFAKQVARKIRKAIPCKKVGLLAAGIKVAHVHLHLVPIHEVSDLDFAKCHPASEETLATVARKINR